jgi:hypothetical protein
VRGAAYLREEEEEEEEELDDDDVLDDEELDDLEPQLQPLTPAP